MGRIEVAVSRRGMGPTPQPFVLVLELDRSQIVDIGPFAVQDLAEESRPGHAQDHHLRTTVTAVLHHDAMTRRLLRRLHEFPAAVDRIGRGYLDGGVLARFHRFDADRYVPTPRRRIEYQVDVVARAEPFPVGFAAGVELGRRTAVVGDPLGNLAGAGLVDVADGDDLDACNAQEVPDVGAALETDADEADSDRLERRRGKTLRRSISLGRWLLGRRPWRRPESCRSQSCRSQNRRHGFQKVPTVRLAHRCRAPC